MLATTFYGCCGLRVIADIVPNAPVTPKGLSASEIVQNQIRNMLAISNILRSGGQKETHNSSLIVLNKAQNDAYAEGLAALGYSVIKEFSNWNERKQPLFLYFKEGGPKADLPAAVVKVKNEPPRKSPTASR